MSPTLVNATLLFFFGGSCAPAAASPPALAGTALPLASPSGAPLTLPLALVVAPVELDAPKYDDPAASLPSTLAAGVSGGSVLFFGTCGGTLNGGNPTVPDEGVAPDTLPLALLCSR